MSAPEIPVPQRPWPILAAATALLLAASGRDVQAADARDAPASDVRARLAEAPIEQIARDPVLWPQALALGRQVFAGACAGCHEPDMKGSPILHTPNLAAFGAGAAEVERTVRYGVGSGHPLAAQPTGTGLMPAFEDVLGPAERKAVAIYVQSGGAPVL